MRIGHGFDAHRLVPNRPLVLGGVNIAYERGLSGHSDADVLTHAVMDALLGAAALGDIGLHFPDSDEKYRGARSLELFGVVGRLVADAGFCVSNIDATLAAQAPRLSPYREQMRQNIASALGLTVDRVNVKFTTEEKMGYTGLGEGMKAYAVCLLEEQK